MGRYESEMDEDTKICSSCGAQMHDLAEMCNKCGMWYEAPPRRKSPWLIALVLLIVVVFVAMILGLWRFL